MEIDLESQVEMWVFAPQIGEHLGNVVWDLQVLQSVFIGQRFVRKDLCHCKFGDRGCCPSHG
jgi:hypothetical protein